MIARYFHFEELNTNMKKEVLGGITTFITMAYIIVVNPAILAAAGRRPPNMPHTTTKNKSLVIGLPV